MSRLGRIACEAAGGIVLFVLVVALAPGFGPGSVRGGDPDASLADMVGAIPTAINVLLIYGAICVLGEILLGSRGRR